MTTEIKRGKMSAPVVVDLAAISADATATILAWALGSRLAQICSGKEMEASEADELAAKELAKWNEGDFGGFSGKGGAARLDPFERFARIKLVQVLTARGTGTNAAETQAKELFETYTHENASDAMKAWIAATRKEFTKTTKDETELPS